MTVAEMIEKLRALPDQSAVVLIADQESGDLVTFDHVTALTVQPGTEADVYVSAPMAKTGGGKSMPVGHGPFSPAALIH